MEFCSRCDGGAIHAPNCPMCGGSGFVDSQKGASASAYSVPSPFQNNASAARLAREEEKRRSVKVYKASARKTPKAPLAKGTMLLAAPAGHPHAKPSQEGATKPREGVPPKAKKTTNKPRGKAKKAPAAKISNTALADQLGALKPEIVLVPAKPPEKRNKKRHAPKNSNTAVPRSPQLSRPKPRKDIPFIPVVNGKVSVEGYLGEKSESRFSTTVGPMRAAGAIRSELPFSEIRDDEEPQDRSGAFQERHREEDGGRYMGHSFREEGGRFGSLPLYDNLDEIDDY